MTASHEDTNPVLPWWAGGIGIGLVLIVAVALVQPIGVSTQYVVLDGVLLHAVLPDIASTSPYLAKTAQGWTLATYEFFFVLGIPLGALVAAMATCSFHHQSRANRMEKSGLARILEVAWSGPSPVDFSSSSEPASAAAAPRGT